MSDPIDEQHIGYGLYESRPDFKLINVPGDLNAAPTGFSLAQAGRPNHPITDRPATVMLTTLPFGDFDRPYIFQTAVAEDNAQTFARYFYDTSWSPWKSTSSA